MAGEHKALLIQAGQALYGERWQTDMAKELGLSDARRIRQWLAGERPIPKGILGDVSKLLADRQHKITTLLESMQASQQVNS